VSVPGVPSYLLKKVYRRGSLKNTPDGFELMLKNSLAPATIMGLSGLSLDGKTLATRAIRLHVGAKWLDASDITAATPLPFALGDLVTLRVEGEPLASGRHDLILSILTREVGRLDLPIGDNVDR
jgi:hydroxymethylglutaryl-CoA reductase (NADPH)